MKNENLEKIVKLFAEEQEKKIRENYNEETDSRIRDSAIISAFCDAMELIPALQAHFLIAIKELDNEIAVAIRLRDFFKTFITEKEEDLIISPRPELDAVLNKMDILAREKLAKLKLKGGE